MKRKSIGIDVSKDKLDMYSGVSEKWDIYANSEEGIGKLISVVKQELAEIVVFECTGAYSRKLARMLEGAGVLFLMVNPRRMRDFARGLGKLAKTDKLDAKVICLYGEKSDDVPLKLRSLEEEGLRDLCMRRQQLVKMIVEDRSRYSQAPEALKYGIRMTISVLDLHVKQINKLIATSIKSSEYLSSRAKILRSGTGVGEVTAAILLSCLPELGQLNKKQVASLCGLAPFNRDSGKFSGEKSIYGGRTVVRSALYMATLSAIRHDPRFKEKYQGFLIKGKKKKVAIIACARKLAITLNAMMRDNQAWRTASA